MCVPNIIAIDGPAASGKSTLGKNLADYLGYLYFDTGVMYRVVTWVALQKGIPIENSAEVAKVAQDIQIDVRPPTKEDGRAYDVVVDGQDLTWEIRRPEVDANVSPVSTYPGVRQGLTEQQRRIGLRGRVVMVGRDIGTVVLPEADLKIFLNASVEERARRRYEELRALGKSDAEILSLQSIRDAMRRRDQIDSTRSLAPLRAAPDAVILSSDNLTANQVLDQVIKIIKRCSVHT